MAYRPRPSQTRRGQFVDDPPLAASDTGELRQLILSAIDDAHAQGEVNAKMERHLAVIQEWRTALTQREKGYASKEAVVFLKWAVGILGGLFASCLIYVLHLIEAVKHP